MLRTHSVAAFAADYHAGTRPVRTAPRLTEQEAYARAGDWISGNHFGYDWCLVYADGVREAVIAASGGTVLVR